MNKRTHAGVAINLRKGPSTNSTILTKLPIGHLVDVDPAQGGWHTARVLHAGQRYEGFLSATVLRDPINPLVDGLVEAAGVELQAWAYGAMHETTEAGVANVKRYWAGAGFAYPGITTAWSAVFISSLVKKAGLGLKFKFSPRHTTYMSDSKVAFQQNQTDRAYYCVPLAHRAVKVGDIVGGYRTGTGCGTAEKTYDSLPGDFCSHCDLVVAVLDGIAYAVGGNVSDSVKVTKIELDSAGKVKPISKRIALMIRRF